MQITCEFCGASVNIKEDDMCPNCGASYADNVDYQERKRIELEKEKLEIEKRKNTYKKRQETARKKANAKRKQRRLSTWICVLCLIFFMVPVLVGIVIGLYEGFTGNDIWNEDYNYNDIVIENEPEFVLGTGTYNETISNNVYTVKIDSIKECNREYYTPSNGYMFVEVHFVLTNIHTEEYQVWEEKVDCIANGFVQQRCWDTERHQISTDFIRPGLSIDGWEVFEIPIDTQVVEIQYGDYIKIVVDSTNIQKISTNKE